MNFKNIQEPLSNNNPKIVQSFKCFDQITTAISL